MTPFRCLAILVCALLVNFGQAWTPTQPAKAAEAPADAADRIKAALPKDKIDEPEVGPVARATTFLDLEISDGKGAKIGQVEDLALDLQENFVAFFVVDLDDLLGGKRVALPLGTVRLTAGAKHLTTDIDAAQVSQAPGIGKDTSLADFNRSRAAAVFSHFGKTPYWQRTDKHGSKSDESADPSSKGPAFASLDDLERMPLQDAAGKELGRIEDFAIAVKTGLIAYAAVVLNDKPQDQLYPLPLSAFVVRPSAKQWVVELTPELIEQTHSIGTGDWPQKVDRAWVEYVHVRYGLSVFSGVRTKLHAIGTKGN